MNHPPGVCFRGTGSALPVRVMHNDDFTSFLDTSDEWIRTRTGIRTRRIAGPGETSATLGLQAARRALESAALTPADLDLILCATVTPVSAVPSNACRIQADLGCSMIPAFDLNAACSGFLYGLALADGMIRGGAHRNVLLVGTETLSRVVDYTDRTSCILFGDGAGAVVVSASDQPKRGVRRIRLFADGNRGDLIHLGSYGGRLPWAGPGSPNLISAEYVKLNGREVFRFAVQRVGCLVREALAACSLTAGDVALVIPHQANQRILDAAFDDLGFPPEKVMSNINRYGNTSAASIPIALDEAIREGRTRQGDTVLLLAFGGGMTWASAVVTM
ncbi:MAG TPA: beta-ketoacyl-ACP synthase III [Gemmataceae bacterium]